VVCERNNTDNHPRATDYVAVGAGIITGVASDKIARFDQ